MARERQTASPDCSPDGVLTPPPRILIVSPEQWPRALLRAELREAGYDAIGAGRLSRTLRYPPEDPERGPVRLLVVDDAAVAAEPAAVEQVRGHYPGARFLLIHRAGAPASGPWAATLQRPVSIGDIVATVRRLVPLAPDRGQPGARGTDKRDNSGG